MSGESDARQRDRDKLRAHGNLLRFSKAKCTVLYLGQGAPRINTARGRKGWFESSPAENICWVLVYEKLNFSWHSVLVTQKDLS